MITLIEDYRNSLTDFQKQPPFDAKWGMLKHERPVFYLHPKKGQDVRNFGQSPNFRVPYIPHGKERAASPYDFIPDALKSSDMVDLAEAIFGFVRDDKQEGTKEQARAGRVFVGDATLADPQQREVWLRDEPVIPHILATPKPTTFQHYLVQPEDDKRNLRHYASDVGGEQGTLIRGHKLYWHKGNVGATHIEDEDFLNKTADEQRSDTQHTQFRPVASGVSFTFTINFENLTDVELGALLWVLHVAAHPDYRLKLGMGKPLGMGSVRIESDLVLNDRRARYCTLFDGDTWASGDSPTSSDSEKKAFVDAFCTYVQEQSGIPSFEESSRIQMLRALLAWPGPERETTRYMKIEHRENPIGGDKNEYKQRFVLPSPLRVQEGSGGGMRTSWKKSSAPHKKPAPDQNIPQVGEIVKGNCQGKTQGGVAVSINRAPRHVRGLIPKKLAGNKTTGGVTAKVIEVVKERGEVILRLEPVKKEKPKQE